jgi:hypothetical protein
MVPSYAVTFRGRPACPCQVVWIPAFEHEAQRRGWLTGEQHIYQLIGGSPLSGGTHLDGGADDTQYLNDNLIWLSRQMGADATWHRPYNWDGHDSGEHVHRVLTGCPHNTPARYQIDAVRAGFNGLGHLGRGAPDNGPRPLSGRTWQRGIEWAKAQENPEEAMLVDLLALHHKYNVSMVKLARIALRSAIASAGPFRRTKIRAALTALPKE